MVILAANKTRVSHKWQLDWLPVCTYTSQVPPMPHNPWILPTDSGGKVKDQLRVGNRNYATLSYREVVKKMTLSRQQEKVTHTGECHVRALRIITQEKERRTSHLCSAERSGSFGLCCTAVRSGFNARYFGP